MMRFKMAPLTFQLSGLGTELLNMAEAVHRKKNGRRKERGEGAAICLQATAVADLEDKLQPRPNFLASGSVREMPQASIQGCP